MFHHMGQLVEEATQQFGTKFTCFTGTEVQILTPEALLPGGQGVKVVHGGCFLAPDRRHGVVSVEAPPTGKLV